MRAVLDAHSRGDLIALRTSGTSGAPRSVVRTTDSWVSSFAHVSKLMSLDAHARVWVPGPLSSTMNLFAAVHAAYVGVATVATPDGATHAHLTPSALSRALDQHIDLSGVHVVVAGDRLSRTLSERASRAVARVSHYYGAAELSFVAWGSHEANLQPFPEVEVSMCAGIVWARSPYLCRRYDGPPGPFQRDADGFATVGDRGAVVGGFLRVTGRGTGAVTTAGATVQVADVEGALRTAGTGEVVVVGVPHPTLGAVVAGVLTNAQSLAAARSVARSELPPSHRPRLWFHVGELPLTSAGKVDRGALAEMLVSPGEGVRRLT